MQLLMRIWPQDAGDLFVNGRDIATYSPDELRAQIGLLKQDSPVFMGTVLSNIFAGRGADLVSDDEKKQQRTVVETFIRRCNFPFNMPDIEERVSGKDNKSGGQNQKIGLLRLAVFETNSLLILDEPTNHLDPECQRWLFSWLTMLKKQRGMQGTYQPTIIIISHQEELVKFVDMHIDFPVPRWMEEVKKRQRGPPPARGPSGQAPPPLVEKKDVVIEVLTNATKSV
jgi:ABC-type multidrug transport system fused ATPase/permease subunit